MQKQQASRILTLVHQLTVISISRMRKRDSWKKFCETIKKTYRAHPESTKSSPESKKRNWGFYTAPTKELLVQYHFPDWLFLTGDVRISEWVHKNRPLNCIASTLVMCHRDNSVRQISRYIPALLQQGPQETDFTNDFQNPAWLENIYQQASAGQI